jgi:hypothetical protein
MYKNLIRLAVASSLLLIGACSGHSKVFDTTCTGTGMIANPPYCTNTLHPVAGPWAAQKNS